MKRKLQRRRGSRRALLKNLALSLILHEKIVTTLQKAKETRDFTERLVQKAKKNNLAARRYLLKVLRKNAVNKLMDDIAPSFSERQSGFIRILHLEPRKGDAAKMAIVSFTEKIKASTKEVEKSDTKKQIEKPKKVKNEIKTKNESKS
ncbi:MAG: 50S ribosomal protein L17 [Candidatus Berkelbacteria bacterium]|nr:50S ribosomal protein L17 [Candidatus Berkelbacteria bacterium]